MVLENNDAYIADAPDEVGLYDEEETSEEQSPQEGPFGEIIGVIALIVGAASTLSCLVLRVAHFPVVGIMSLIGIVLNIIAIVTDRARVLATFGIILSLFGMSLTVLVILKLLHWL